MYPLIYFSRLLSFGFSELVEALIFLVLGFLILGFKSGHDSLQNPQLPWPPICSKSSSTFVEHQYLPSGSVSLMQVFLKVITLLDKAFTLPKMRRQGSQWLSYKTNIRHPLQLKKIKILGAVLELPAKQHCQSSPFTSKLGQIGQIGSAV